MLRGFGVAGLALAASIIAAAAQEMKSPRISSTQVDWDAAVRELASIDSLKQADVPGVMAELNRATGERFANIAASPVPVLLPFDTASFLRERAAAANTADPAAGMPNAPGDYLSGFSAVTLFYPGPAGYDAVVRARAQDMSELAIGFADPIYIHIGGSALVYEVDEPVGMIGWPVHGLEGIPGIRRMYLENYVRYTFVRYGVPYVVAIECSDSGLRVRRMSCRDADKVAVRFLKALRLTGGTPRDQPAEVDAGTIDRPPEQSEAFTYHSPGDIIPGTGFRRKGGVADYTVYSRIRFPIAEAPAFANSQSFMNWGNCEATGRSGAGKLDGVSAYRCRVSGQTLISDESATANYSYPWRDNFCEHRNFYVGQCPGGLGHQGQDIRPASCKQRIHGANRCEPYLHDVVAVRDGVVLRAPRQEALYIVVNAPSERIRVRYLHMLPRQFDADGMLSGRVVREGEVIGKVGNFFKRERATTYHLHFDLQVPTRYGWVFVNPYMTLVASYERLIQARGQEIKEQDVREDVPTASIPIPPVRPASGAAVTAAKPTETVLESPAPEKIKPGIRHDERIERVGESSPIKASMPAAAGGRIGRIQRTDLGAGQQVGVRAMGRGVPRPGPRAWRLGRDLHAGHEQYQARHRGL